MEHIIVLRVHCPCTDSQKSNTNSNSDLPLLISDIYYHMKSLPYLGNLSIYNSYFKNFVF